MKYLKKFTKLCSNFLANSSGNALLLSIAAAISAAFAIYFFVVVSSLQQKEKEQITHLYNAYQMSISIDAMIKNSIFTKGRLEVNFKSADGEHNYIKEEFEKFIAMGDTSHIYTTRTHCRAIYRICTRSHHQLVKQVPQAQYDKNNTKIKVVFDMVLSHYDDEGNAIKMVDNVFYYVNLAGQPVVILIKQIMPLRRR